MKNAFIFPGQGSQKIGMGKQLSLSFPEAKEVFDEVDDSLNESLSNLIWEGKIEDLTMTENAQPALMANSIAILAVLESQGFDIAKVDFVAGHSLGEYSALCAAKSLSIGDTARLLRIRGKAMQTCVTEGQGTMAAILGLAIEDVEQIVNRSAQSEVCQIANDNDPNQVVISGHTSAVERSIDLAKKKGAKRAILLNVSAPFHCDLMLNASKEMQIALEEVKLCTPKSSIVMNTTARLEKDPKTIKDCLIDQVIGCVRWRESIQFMVGMGVKNFYELGDSTVLSGMVRRISKENNCLNVCNEVSVNKFFEVFENV